MYLSRSIYIYLSLSLNVQLVMYTSLSLCIYTRLEPGMASDICSVWEWGIAGSVCAETKLPASKETKRKRRKKRRKKRRNKRKTWKRKSPLAEIEGWNQMMCGYIVDTYPYSPSKWVLVQNKFTPLVESVHEISAPGRSEHGELHGGPDLGPIHRPGSTSSLKT